MDMSAIGLTSFETVMIEAVNNGFSSIEPAFVKLGVIELAGNGGAIGLIDSDNSSTTKGTITLELAMGTATTFNLSTSPVTITGLSGPRDVFRIAGDTDSEAITGSTRKETISSGGGTDILTGLGGNDTYLIADFAASVIEASDGGNDTIDSTISQDLANFANIENLTLTNASGTTTGFGNEETNILDGSRGGGVSNFAGLGGDDLYVLGVGDTASETLAGTAGGTDTVRTDRTFILGDNLENLTLTGNEFGVSGTGNGLDNILDGSLNFRVNTLAGLAGNDTYIVNTGDIVSETLAGAAGGIDTIRLIGAIVLTDNVENLVLLGNLDVAGTGNGLANVLDGSQNGGNNALRGQDGNDTYLVGANDSVSEFAAGSEGGVDLVRTAFARILSANVENLTLMGTAAVAGRETNWPMCWTGLTTAPSIFSKASSATTLISWAVAILRMRPVAAPATGIW